MYPENINLFLKLTSFLCGFYTLEASIETKAETIVVSGVVITALVAWVGAFILHEPLPDWYHRYLSKSLTTTLCLLAVKGCHDWSQNDIKGSIINLIGFSIALYLTSAMNLTLDFPELQLPTNLKDAWQRAISSEKKIA